MHIDIINTNIASNGVKRDAPAKENPVSYKEENVKDVCSENAAFAIKAANLPKIKNYAFLKNINIPALNLNGNLYVLQNGQKCFIAKNNKPCMIKTYFNVGSINEPDNLRGISHFIEHNMFNGSKNYKPNEFAEKTNRMGAMYNASTGYTMTDYYILSPLHKDTDLKEFIKMHADMLVNPTFPNDMIEKEKGPVISELQMYEDKPEQLANNAVLKNLFNIKTTSPDLVAGNIENIRNITRDDVIKYYRENYSPQNAITFIIGNVDEEKTIELLSENFSDFKSTTKTAKRYEKLTPITKSVRQDLYSPNTKSTIINLGFAGPSDLKEQNAMDLLLGILTGHKNARLTELFRSMNMKIDSTFENITNQKGQPSLVSFSTETTKKNEEDILRTLYQKIHEMTYIPVSEKELNTVKKIYINASKRLSETNSDIVNIIGKEFSETGNFNRLTNFEKNIKAITPEDIMNVTKKFLDLNRASIAVVHPPKSKNVSFNGKINNHQEIKTYTASNNAEVSFLNVSDSNFYSLNFELVNDNIPFKYGVASVFGEMLKHGSSLMTEKDFYSEQEENGITSYSNANRNSISYNCTFPKESLNISCDNLFKNIFYPALTPENFEKAKTIIKNTYLTTQRMATDRALETLYEGTPKGFSLRKLYEDVEKVTYYDVINFYNTLMQNPKCRIALSGNFSDRKVSNSIYGKMSNLGKIFKPNTPNQELVIKPLEQTKIVTETDSRNQANIVKVFHIKESGNIKDSATILLLNEILGGSSNSRLFQDLREKQKLAYYTYSKYNCKDLNGTLIMSIGTTTEDKANSEQYKNLQKAIDGFNNHITKLINEKVSTEELEAAKTQLKSELIFQTQTIDGKNLMLSIGMNSLYKEKYYEMLLKAIDTITPENIQNIAKYYLSKPSVTSVIASKDTIAKNKDYLQTLGELKQF